jgi:hypothetical protein
LQQQALKITMVLVVSNNTPFSAMDPPAGKDASSHAVTNVLVKSSFARPKYQPEPPPSAKALAAALVAQQSKDDEVIDEAREGCPVTRDSSAPDERSPSSLRAVESSSFDAANHLSACGSSSDQSPLLGDLSKLLPFKTPHKQRQVDYDDDCTTLYKKVENKDWYAVDMFLENGGYWPGSLLKDKMTPGEQCSTWVTRYEYEKNCLSILPHFLTLPDPTSVLWSTLPLHLAVALKAPFITVGRLVEREYNNNKCFKMNAALLWYPSESI